MEHNLYHNYGPRLKKITCDILKKNNYTLVCENITNDYKPYEDWWVDAKYINKGIYSKYMCKNKD